MTSIPIRLAQEVFKKAGLYKGAIDGIFGPGTRAACNAVTGEGITYAVQIVLRKAGHSIDLDGLFGPATEAAAEEYAGAVPWKDITDVPGDTRWPTYSELQSFYGAPGTGHTRLTLPYKMRIAWAPEQTVYRITCHKKVKEPFERIFAGTLAHYGKGGIEELGLDMFGGCFNNRKMRGGNRLSTHAYACAIDLDPARNRLKWGRPQARLSQPDAIPFWELVEAEGMVSLGRAKNYDWMHFQGCR